MIRKLLLTHLLLFTLFLPSISMAIDIDLGGIHITIPNPFKPNDSIFAIVNHPVGFIDSTDVPLGLLIAMSDDGNIAVGDYLQNNGSRQAEIFLKNKNRFPIPFPNVTPIQSQATAISPKGKYVVGTYQTKEGNPPILFKYNVDTNTVSDLGISTFGYYVNAVDGEGNMYGLGACGKLNAASAKMLDSHGNQKCFNEVFPQLNSASGYTSIIATSDDGNVLLGFQQPPNPTPPKTFKIVNAKSLSPLLQFIAPPSGYEINYPVGISADGSAWYAAVKGNQSDNIYFMSVDMNNNYKTIGINGSSALFIQRISGSLNNLFAIEVANNSLKARMIKFNNSNLNYWKSPTCSKGETPSGDSKCSSNFAAEICRDDFICSEKAKRAEITLHIIDRFPIDSKTSINAMQNARLAINSCYQNMGANSQLSMARCSGYLVTPGILALCLNNGPCLPMHTTKIVSDSQIALLRNANFDSIEKEQSSLINKNLNRASASVCREKSNSPEEFSACLVEISNVNQFSNNTLGCFGKYRNDPIKYGACVSNIEIDKATISEIACVNDVRINGRSASCLNKMPTAVSKAISCLSDGNGDLCFKNLSNQEAINLSCIKAYSGDSLMLSACLSDHANLTRINPAINSAKTVLNNCTSNKGDDVSSVLGCITNDHTFSSALNINPALLKDYNTAKQYTDCITNHKDDKKNQTDCLMQLNNAADKVSSIAACLNSQNDNEKIANCLSLKDFPHGELINEIQTCLNDAGHDTQQRALCLAARTNLPEGPRHFVSCLSSGKVGSNEAACIVGPYLNKDEAKALSCVTSGPTACALNNTQMNAELRIAAECAVNSGGEPLTMTSCTGSRLAAKELMQCISGDWKAENGCFGDGNEIVKYFKSQEKALRAVFKGIFGNDAVYDNLLKDLKTGQLGPNNDVVKGLNSVNYFLANDVTTATNNIGAEVGKAPAVIGGFIQSAGQEAQKFAQDIVTNPQKALDDLRPPNPIPGYQCHRAGPVCL